MQMTASALKLPTVAASTPMVYDASAEANEEQSLEAVAYRADSESVIAAEDGGTKTALLASASASENVPAVAAASTPAANYAAGAIAESTAVATEQDYSESACYGNV